MRAYNTNVDAQYTAVALVYALARSFAHANPLSSRASTSTLPRTETMSGTLAPTCDRESGQSRATRGAAGK